MVVFVAGIELVACEVFTCIVWWRAVVCCDVLWCVLWCGVFVVGVALGVCLCATHSEGRGQGNIEGAALACVRHTVRDETTGLNAQAESRDARRRASWPFLTRESNAHVGGWGDMLA